MKELSGFPAPQGLYDPQFEKDSCGVGFVVNIDGSRSNQVIRQGLEVLLNLRHRGACGCDPETGDGAGLLMQVPHEFLAHENLKMGLILPPRGEYAIGMAFLPTDAGQRQHCESILEEAIAGEGQILLGWRDVPVKTSAVGRIARLSQPAIRQFFVGRGKNISSEEDFERKLYLIRRTVENAVEKSGMAQADYFYLCSLSSRTIVYKGQLMAEQLPHFFKDLSDPLMRTAFVLVHSRFSTNTFPSWKLAHPFRFLAHNGEINTLRGNRNWMRSRYRGLQSPYFGEKIRNLLPVVTETGSDSATLDNAFEFLVMGGRSLPHAMMMLIPEAWNRDTRMDPDKQGFYEYHACLMEAWDGPAAVAFTDGKRIGAVLDRNGLRPARYIVTKDNQVIMASETGVLDVPPEKIVQKGRLQPGKIFFIDLEEKRIVEDEEIKRLITSQKPYRQWVEENRIELHTLPNPPHQFSFDAETLFLRQQVFGYTMEDLRILLLPMGQNGEEAVGSMGTDTPLAVLSNKPQLLYNYFKQLFAQVTNPPIDSIREEMVMSLEDYIGRGGNLLEETPEHCHMVRLPGPILTNTELAKLRYNTIPDFKTVTLDMLFPVAEGKAGLTQAVERLSQEASAAIREGASILILSDRGVNADFAPIPSLLATSAVHHHLVREGSRNEAGLIIESGEARESMHFALLMGYGASTINPYLAFEALTQMAQEGLLPADLTIEKIHKNYIKAVAKALLKIIAKMGISTMESYRGAQIFEAIGLNAEMVDRYFTGTPSRIQGIGLEVIAEEALLRHRRGFPDENHRDPLLDEGGQYQWRQTGEFHLFNPETIAKLQHSVRQGNFSTYKEYAELVNNQNHNLCTLRGLFRFKAANPIPVREVEPAVSIVHRFATGAMSFGSISKEAHESLAIAMNRLGGRSNTGEGGEDPERFTPDANGDSRRSSVKQVASGRFGVTIEYLVNADELQIKMAQGAKPGEGGQLPGHKVDQVIAKTRHSIPGVSLISPPPHHDIYSIEDLAQLIFDLKNANSRARISVKLVAEVGVGTVAAGVAKAHADVVLISGHDGGTGASPLTSIKHSGIPWELGLAETHQVLVLNNLRGRIVVQTDGQLKTGRDVVIAALLGAEEFGFATAPLVTLGCIMMRKCHLNTCPVGIATQDPILRQRFAGKPEHVINFFFYVAEEVREIMAQLGIRRFSDLIGRADLLDVRPAIDHWKARDLDLSPILSMPKVPRQVPVRCVESQDHGIDQTLDVQLIRICQEALEHKKPIRLDLPISNADRTVCTRLSGEIARRYGLAGLPEDTIRIKFSGSAGQSFGAFLAQGITLILEGDANDYTGKGLSGGRMIVFPPLQSAFIPEENVLIGNTVLYGATSGEAYFRGMAGERFAVRNSGASAVVEGVGDHGCEYMTGGRVVVLGPAGRNFAAGMSGGVAYVLDAKGDFAEQCNTSMVELEPLEQEEDLNILRTLVEGHWHYTGSTPAKLVLDNWNEMTQRFVKVMPKEFKRVLRQAAKETAGAVA
jgi:glutamate synthase domain-containing protein 2/glutamate synthase domain-containing protein 1/glutamate synthase domain-containing protein 3